MCWVDALGVRRRLDGMDKMTTAVRGSAAGSAGKLDALMPQMLEDDAVADRDPLESSRDMILRMYQTQKGMQDQGMAMPDEPAAPWATRSTTPMNDDTFYLPPEIFNNEDFKRGMDSFISPDGKSVRFIISHER